MPPLSSYFLLSGTLFCFGLFGFIFSRRNFVIMLMAIEMMILASNLLLASFARAGGVDPAGEIFVLFSLTVSAAEAAIGLALFVIYFRQKTSIQADHPHSMRG